MAAPFKRIMVLDFETYWDSKSYTLSKMTTESYVRDPRFKVFGMCYKWHGEDTKIWLSGKRLEDFCKSVDWSTTAVVCQNTVFDGSILAWHYGVVPAFYFDTLSMARAVRGPDSRNSLAVLAEDLGLPAKGRAVHSTDGLETLSFGTEKELADYCKHDTWLCEKVFDHFLPHFSFKELQLIDMTMRMYTQPRITLDTSMLKENLDADNTAREELLAQLNVTEGQLASNDKFAELLRVVGVEPPRKISKTTNQETWAFAKNDAHFQQLCVHEDERVALLCEARLRAKSTQTRTRAERLLDIATRGTLPVPLSYWGAHTGRWAAGRGEAINLQNLKRGSFLRKALMAPEGYTFVVTDLSQIEPRVLAWYAGYDELLDIFRSGEDAYATFGAQMFGIPGMTKETHPELRQSAKSALLGAGYSLGFVSFAAQLLTGFLGAPPIRYDKKFLKQLGCGPDKIERLLADEDRLAQVLAIPRTCSDAEIVIHAVAAREIIDRYREAARSVVGLWRLLSEALEASLLGGAAFEYKGLRFEKEEIFLPSGMALRYPDLRGVKDDTGKVQYVYGPRMKKLYGGKLAENITQAVARIVMTDGMLRIKKRYPVVLTVHDEVVVLAPIEEAEEAAAWCNEQMVKEPAYLPGIPLAAETGVGVRYGEAK